jgi:hypothetical protein
MARFDQGAYYVEYLRQDLYIPPSPCFFLLGNWGHAVFPDGVYNSSAELIQETLVYQIVC